ncbi:MAG: substrate-binding domain-containing protein [Armatimonadetes bacterium]|nr:substrate-binding domain-containing protein [Armatimonadota bacterium]
MKLTNTGKFTILIVTVGVAFAAWRVFGPSIMPAMATVGKSPSRKQFSVLASSTHVKVLQKLAQEYNTKSDRQVAFAPPMETRNALHAILDEKQTDTAGWLSSCDELGRRLNEAYKGQHGTSVLNPDDPDSYVTVARVPVVALAKSSSEDKVRAVFESDNPWSRMVDSGLRWSFADPLDSSSGTLVLGYILWGYAKENNVSMTAASKSPGFQAFVSRLHNHGFVAAQQGSRAHTDLFVEGNLDVDCVLNYSTSLQSAIKNKSGFVIVWPRKTVFASHVFAVLQTAPEADQAAAKDFAHFLASRYPKPSVPDSVESVALPAYYPYLNDAELAWSKEQ